MPQITVTGLVLGLINFYETLIIVYVLLSWFRGISIVDEVSSVIGTLVEPYLGLFRRIIPPFGMLDISPIVAILVLYAIASAVPVLLNQLGVS